MVKKSFLKSSLTILAIVALVAAVFPIANVKAAAAKPSLTYSAHVQTYGDSDEIEASEELEELADRIKGEPASYVGTMGEAKRMEALTIAFGGIDGVSLEYQAHVQGDGWLTKVPVTKEGTTIAGTTGKSKRLEAIKITVAKGLDKLTAAGYEIKYRAHVQGIGWQDWVTADDKSYDKTEEGFAGTVDQSKRIEAIEIALVHKHVCTYVDAESADGVSQHRWKCTICNETGIEACTFGEWTSTDGINAERVCVCGKKETKALTKVLSDETVTEVEVNKVNSKLTVPADKTLTVDDQLEGSADVTVKGTLVMKKMPNSSAKLSGTGTVIWAPEATNISEINQLPAALKLSDGKVTSPKTSLKYEIKLPELAKPLTITDNGEDDYLTIGEGYNISLDLGGNTLAFEKSQSLTRDGLILNKGNLTIKNGTLSDNGNTNVTAGAGKYILKNVKDQKKLPTLTLENVTITTKGDGIAAEEGTLTMKNSSITAGGKDCIGLSVGYSDTANGVHKDMAKSPVTLENVKINNVGYGVIAHSTNATVTLNNVDIKATTFALHINAKETANNSFVVTGGTYESTSAAVAYLAGTGKSTFTNCTLKGPNGIETTGTELTLNGTKIEATGKVVNGEVAPGKSTELGSAIILKNYTGYGDKAGIKLTVTNSELSSANGYAVNVAAGSGLNPVVKTINISYDSASFAAARGKLGVQTVADSLKTMTHTTVNDVETEVE